MLRLGILQGLRHAALSSRPPPPSTLLCLRFASTLGCRRPCLPRTSPVLAALKKVRRGAASSVSGKPASLDLPHAVQNAREEAKGLVSDVAKIIAAANFSKEQHSYDGFSDLTTGLAAEVPKPILITGLAGALPYVGTAASTLYFSHQAGLLAAGHAAGVDYDTALNLLEAATTLQVTYGAVLLSFLGALHWGMEFAGYGGMQGYRRLAVGVVPVVFAWSTLALDPSMALVTQWLGFTSMWYVDMRATSAGWTPIWYSQYRFYLSILIGTCMVLTLFGQWYFNPVVEATMFAASGPNARPSQAWESTDEDGKLSGTMKGLGEIETVEGDSYFVVLTKKGEKEAEEGEASGGEGESTEVESHQEEKERGQQSGEAGEVKQKPDKPKV